MDPARDPARDPVLDPAPERSLDVALLHTFVSEVRTRVGPADEGTIWALYLDRAYEPLLAAPLSEGVVRGSTDGMRTVAYLLGNAGAHALVVAVPRPDGQPTRADREFWRRLRVLMVCEPTELLDLLVVGPDTFWSAQRDDDTRWAVA